MNKILYVDDRSDLRDSLEAQLSEFNFVFTSSSLQAKDLVQKEKFAVVISDIIMPFIDGLELCRITRKENPETPFLFITEDRTLKLIEQCLEIPNSYTLSKVSPVEHYRASINRLLKTEKSAIVFGISSVMINDEKYNLTPLEMRLLKSLIEADYLCPKNQLKRMAWEEQVVCDRTLNTHVSNLRQKISGSGWTLSIQRDGFVKLFN